MNTDQGRLNFRTGIDNSTLRADAEQSKSILHGIGSAAEKEGNRIDATFRNIGKSIVGVFTIQQAAQFARQIVTVRGEMESLEKSFEILAGKEWGKRLYNDIKDYAVKTPMLLGDLAKGAQVLLSFNTAAEDVMPILRAIGDISMGNAEKFNSLVLAFSQMRSTGKLMGQDLLQMINAGFNPLSVISEQTGKSIGTLKEEMSAGAISADMITQAFMDATSEGGKFYGMLEEQSKGVKGQISNLEGAFEEMLNDIGQKSQGVITGSIEAATALVQNYERVGKIIAELVVTFGVYKAALITVNTLKGISASLTAGWTVAELAHYNALVLVEKAQALLNKTIMKNPYVLAAAAVAGLAYSLYKYFEVEDQTRKAAEDHAEAIDKLNGKYAEERANIDTLINKIQSETTARVDRIEAMNELKTLYPEIFQRYIDEKGHITDLIGLQRELNEVQASRRMQDDSEQLRLYQSYLNDYKRLQTATENGWDWATAGTTNNVNKLTEDWGFFQSKGSFLKEKIDYWTQMVKKQQEVVDANNLTIYADSLADKTDEELQQLKELYDSAGTLSEIDKQRQAALESEIASRQPTAIIKNKKYWEDYKKEQQGLLDAMTSAQLQTEEAAKIRQNISDAQAQIDAYSVAKSGKADEQENKEEVQKAQRAEKIRLYSEEVSREARQAELDIEQARIDGMNEGVEKELAQNELNYKRLVEANIRRQEEMVERLRDVRELEWQNANPDADKQGKTFDRTTVTAADLSDEQKDIIAEYARIAEETRQKANRDSLDSMLDDVLTYEQARLRITEEYTRKRNSLYQRDDNGAFVTDGNGNRQFRQGVTQGNLDELDRNEEDALAAVDEQFAQREASYQAWCNEIANLTLEQLLSVLGQAEQELANLENSGTADDSQMATARAKVSAVKKKVEKASAEDSVSPGKRSVKEWEDLYKVLNECNDTFEEIGDTVGGVAGEIISSAGGIMTSTLSMINGIVQLVQMSASGMTATAGAAATAISTVEKASVILTVISAALQIAMQIANLFNRDDEKQAEIEALQERIDQLQWELDNADALRLQENSFNAMDMLKQSVAETRVELIKMNLASGNVRGAIAAMSSSGVYNNELLQKSAETVAKAYANVAYTADKALSGAKYDNAKEQMKNIAKQQLLIQEEINKEQDKKKTDQGKIEEWERQIQELGEQAVTIINELVEDIIGGTSTDIANELADAFFDAFEAGEDAAEAWGDKVNDIVADIIKRMMVQKFLEEPLGKIFDEYKNKWFKDWNFAGIDAVINSMTDFADDLNSVGEYFAAIWDSLPEDIKNMFTVTGDATREASKEGIATASQESVDELNGRMTAVQGHTYSISENTKLLVANSAAILESVLNIESHTEVIARRVESIEAGVVDVRSTVNDIVIKGIKIK